MKIKDIIFNAVWFGVVPKLTVLATLVVTPLVTPYLTRSDYGNIGIINSYVGLIMALSTLGLHMHLPNTFFELKNNYKKAWGRLLFLMSLGGFFSMILAAICLTFSLKDTFYPKALVIFLAVIPIFINVNQQISNSYYTLMSRPKALVLRNLGATLFGIALFFISARYFKLGYLSWLISSSASAVLLFFLFLKPLWIHANLYPRIEKSKKRILYWLKISLPIIPHSIGHTILVSSDRIIMNILGVSTSLIGIYSQGHIMGDYVNTIIIGLLAAVSPLTQKYYRDSNFIQLKKLFYIVQIFSLFLIFFCCIWMKEIYYILIKNPSLQEGQDIACYTMFAYAIFPLYSFLSLPAFVQKKTKTLLWLIWVPAIINIVLNFIAIPIWGYKAAIVVTLCAYWIMGIIIIYHPYYKKELCLWMKSANKVWLLLVIYILLLFIANFLASFPITLKATISFILLAGIGLYIYKLRKIQFDYIEDRI